MPRAINRQSELAKVAAIVRDAGGRVVGRTRLQKMAYLLELAGLGEGFSFEYRHYGPYSEELAASARFENLVGFLKEKEMSTSWGGFYSVFTVAASDNCIIANARVSIARIAAAADPVELELAATAAFLASKGERQPWKETKVRKPEKASDERIERAKVLYKQLSGIDTPVALPLI